ncbi:MAG: Lrp/AsnC family transcriptional regulator [Planctomycetes bacterium]|nr:Lrp/AsnC family transcriptional regulator [Planctomycetota bacterium]
MNCLCEDDLAVLAALEDSIPLEVEPFGALAAALGVSEEEFLARTRRLADRAVIKRLAVVFDSRALGFATRLVAAGVRPGRNEEAAALVNSFDEVTHNYRRGGGRFGMWFTLVAAGPGRIEKILSTLTESGLFEEIVELPAEKVFKVRLRLSPLVHKET